MADAFSMADKRAQRKVSSMFSQLDALEERSNSRAEAHRDASGKFVQRKSANGRSSSSQRDASSSALATGSGGPIEDEDVTAPATYKMCSGMYFRTDSGSAPESSGIAPRPMSDEALRKQMDEMLDSSPNRKKMPSMPSRRSLLQEGVVYFTRESSATDYATDVRDVKWTSQTFAEQIAEQGSSGLEGLAGMTNEARRNRKREQEEKRASRLASRQDRQFHADQARVDFGPTTRDKKERRERQEKMDKNAFLAAQASAGKDFSRRSRRIIVANGVAIISQVLFVYDAYQGKSVELNLPSGQQDPAPRFVFIYTLCGISGSVLALFIVTVLSAVLVSNGLKARSLQTLCPLMVHFQYLSAFLQELSLFNHIGYMSVFYERVPAYYPGPPGQPIYTVLIIAQLALAAALPPIMIFCIMQTKQMCYNNFKKFVSPEMVQKHIYIAIGTGQILSGLLVMGICSLNAYQLFQEINGIPAEQVWHPLLINWNYIVYPFYGLVSLSLGLYYLSVTGKMSKYELEAMHIEETKESALLAGQRVLLIKGTACTLKHIVDKPSLNGQHGTIESSGVDDQGKVLVSIEGKEVRVEEFQIGVTTPAKELEDIKERAKLRTAEIQYLFEKKGESLAVRQRLYVTLGQAMCGFLCLALALLLIQAQFCALTVYQFLREDILNSYAQLDIDQKAENGIQHQLEMCADWSRCFEGTDRPSFCGTCAIPIPAEDAWGDLLPVGERLITAEMLVQPTFVGKSLFSGSSLVYIIIGASIGGGVGFIIAIIFLRGIAKVKLVWTCCYTLFIVILFAIIGVAAAPIPSILVPYNGLSEAQCTAFNNSPKMFRPALYIDPECLLLTSAMSAKKKFEDDARYSVMGTLVNALIFLFESLSNLARAIQARGPTQWAKFEAEVFFIYYLIVAALLLGVNILQNLHTPELEAIEDAYWNTTAFGTEMSEIYGEAFPILVENRWSFQRQRGYSKESKGIADGYWYNLQLTLPILIGVVIAQLFAIVSGRVAPEKFWIPTFRAVLVFDSVLILTIYLSMTYLSVQANNLVNNMIFIIILPLMVQFGFAIFYACKSEILPIFENLPANPIFSTFIQVSYVLPVAGIVLCNIGLSYGIFYGFSDGVEESIPPPAGLNARSTSTGLLMTGIIILGVFGIAFVVTAAKRAIAYYLDWSQMAADKLAEMYPTVFGAPVEVEEDAEAPRQKVAERKDPGE